MALYQIWVIKPDGTFPLIGDTFSKDKPSKELWEDNQNYLYALTSGVSGLAPEGNASVFRNAGYAIFRDDWSNGVNSTYIHFTAAYHTSYHKHSDDLSIWIYAKGHDIVTEAGPYGYQYDLPYTQYAYSSYAHNTLIVNNQGLPRVDGKFGKTYISEYDLGDKISSVTGVNKRYENVTHIRKLEYNRETNVILVKDRITSNKKNNYKILWNFAPNVEPLPIKGEKNQYSLLINGEEIMTLKINSKDIVNIQIVKGQKHPCYLGWNFTELENPIPIYTMVIEVDAANAEIESIFTIK